MVRILYSSAREKTPWLFKTLISPKISQALGYWNYDVSFTAKLTPLHRFIRNLNVDFSECVDDPLTLDTPRKIFERKIRYWETRHMKDDPWAVTSPADARIVFGSFAETSHLFLKEKFFEFEELLGQDKPLWRAAFDQADYAIFRLTPDKYHYNHMPVSGTVLDIYEIPGTYHSCNPDPVITIVTPFSKNKRVVTIIDTEVSGGSGVGLVAMIEVVALMIGAIVQCYSESRYDEPQAIHRGMFLKKGRPKSLYRPGSSTDVLLFQKGKVEPCQDLMDNLFRHDVVSRYSVGFGRTLVETDVKVRSTIATSLAG